MGGKKRATNKRLSASSNPQSPNSAPTTSASPQKRTNDQYKSPHSPSHNLPKLDTSTPTKSHSSVKHSDDPQTDSRTHSSTPNGSSTHSDDKDVGIRVIDNRAIAQNHQNDQVVSKSVSKDSVDLLKPSTPPRQSHQFPSPFVSTSSGHNTGKSSDSSNSANNSPRQSHRSSSKEIEKYASSIASPVDHNLNHSPYHAGALTRNPSTGSRSVIHNVALSPSSQHPPLQPTGMTHHSPHHIPPPISTSQHTLSPTNYLTTSPSVQSKAQFPSHTPHALNHTQPTTNNEKTEKAQRNAIPTTLPDDLPSPKHHPPTTTYLSPLLTSPQQSTKDPHKDFRKTSISSVNAQDDEKAEKSPHSGQYHNSHHHTDTHTKHGAAMDKMGQYDAISRQNAHNSPNTLDPPTPNPHYANPHHNQGNLQSPTLSTSHSQISTHLPQKLHTTSSPVSQNQPSYSTASQHEYSKSQQHSSTQVAQARRPSVSANNTSTIKQVPASTLVNHTYRLIVIGAEGCGKTSLLRRFASNSFTPQYLPTIGVDFLTSTFVSNSGAHHTQSNGQNQNDTNKAGGNPGVTSNSICTKLHIWDSSGSSRFSSLIPSYLKDCSVCLLCFDLTNLDSYTAIFDQYLPSIRHTYGDNIIIIAVGCKSDLTRQRVVGYAEIKEETKKFSLPYLETSAKTGNNVSILFSQIASILPEIDQNHGSNKGPDKGKSPHDGHSHSLGDSDAMNRSGGITNETTTSFEEEESRGLCFWRCW